MAVVFLRALMLVFVLLAFAGGATMTWPQPAEAAEACHGMDHGQPPAPDEPAAPPMAMPCCAAAVRAEAPQPIASPIGERLRPAKPAAGLARRGLTPVPDPAPPRDLRT